MKKKETQQGKGQLVTSSLPLHRVSSPAQRATIPQKTQPLEVKEGGMEVFLLRNDQVIQVLARWTSLLLAVINGIMVHNVVITLLFLGIATDTFSIQEAIRTLFLYLQSRSSCLHEVRDNNQERVNDI